MQLSLQLMVEIYWMVLHMAAIPKILRVIQKYDMLVMNDGFYLIHYRGANRIYPVVYRWNFDKKSFSGVVESEHEYDLFRPGEVVPHLVL